MSVEGTRFGRYHLQQLLGEGGMGQVYRAHDSQTGRIVAVKLLHPHMAADPVYRERFQREARAAAGLVHPNVVPIFDFGEVEDRLFICMQFVTGVGVDAVLAESGPMPVARAVSVVAQAAAALDDAHAEGLMHRDVKPSNLLVTARDFVYLIDFGIARAVGETALTTTGATIGTFAYMAPERFSTGVADARSDVYALACVLYQCLTGQTPYPATALEQQIAAHLTQPPPKPSQARPQIGTVLDHVVATGMAKNPEERYRTAGELAAACLSALEGAPAPAATEIDPGSRADPSRRMIIRRVLTALALMGLAAVGVVAGAAFMKDQSEGNAALPSTTTSPLPATTSAPSSIPATTAVTTTQAPILPGPGTHCGTVNMPNGKRIDTMIDAGSISCTNVKSVLTQYYLDVKNGKAQGSGAAVSGVVDVSGRWDCISETYAEGGHAHCYLGSIQISTTG
ncbi:serine/threonine-protein kinase [Nocardia sp. NPDC005825]|uniref:serine/threonine-protein kinase n=1 Tax=unclassified Nocardia TaxID=2637762 RepID=UPI0033CB0A14